MRTFRDLKNVLDNLTDDELQCNLSIEIDGEFMSGAEDGKIYLLFADEADVLDKNHPFLSLS